MTIHLRRDGAADEQAAAEATSPEGSSPCRWASSSDDAPTAPFIKQLRPAFDLTPWCEYPGVVELQEHELIASEMEALE